jgi:hypothetical protein
MTPESFAAQGFTEVGMDRVIAQTKEARMTGVVQKPLTDLLLSRFAPIKKVNLGSAAGRSIIAPFIMVPQRHNINANYFVIDSGANDPNAGVGNVHPGSYRIIVKNESSEFASPLVSLEKYFLVGRFVTVLYKDATTGVGRTLQFKITAVANANAGGVEKARITLEPPYTSAGWNALAAGDKNIYKPTHGLVIPLANSVSNYESWCGDDAAEQTGKLLVYWLQTIRETHCYNDAYLQALQAPLTSEYLKRFRLLPLAQQRKRQAQLAERAFYNTVWFGQKINEKQTAETYASLPPVYDIADVDCVLEYKANTEGIETQLSNCGKVTDLQGGALDIDLIKTTLYTLKRNREIDSGNITQIDAMTDRYTADNILTVMIDYYKKKYGVSIERFFTAKQAITFEGQVLWNYNVYEFPEEGVALNVIHDTYFDDYLAAFPSADKSMGRYLMLVDWSDVKIGLAGTASRNTETFIQSDDYQCVITANVTHRNLNSKSIAVMIEDPNRSAIFKNFSDACPTVTVNTCTAAS